MENDFTGSGGLWVECVQDLGLGMDLILLPFEKQYVRKLGLKSTGRGNGQGQANKLMPDDCPNRDFLSLASGLRAESAPSPGVLSWSSSSAHQGKTG